MANPHSPAIFLPDGQIDSMLATYETQLKYTDNVLGNFLEVMKAQGTYDHSWVLVTSDHGHHGFDLSPTAHRHVPFIVKAPGSQCARAVRPSLPLWRLAPFFQNIFAWKDVASCIRDLPVPVHRPKPSRRLRMAGTWRTIRPQRGSPRPKNDCSQRVTGKFAARMSSRSVERSSQSC